MALFVGQELLDISLDTEIDLTQATSQEILYEKPSGARGTFAATKLGTVITHELAEGEIDEAGVWKFQAHVVINTKDAYGDVVEYDFLPNLTT